MSNFCTIEIGACIIFNVVSKPHHSSEGPKIAGRKVLYRTRPIGLLAEEDLLKTEIDSIQATITPIRAVQPYTGIYPIFIT